MEPVPGRQQSAAVVSGSRIVVPDVGGEALPCDGSQGATMSGPSSLEFEAFVLRKSLCFESA